MLFRVGDEVSWKYVDGTGQGQIIEITGNLALVEYGPWCDMFWIKIGSLTKEGLNLGP